MNLQDIKNYIAFLNNPNCVVELIFLLNNEDEINPRRWYLSSDIQQEVISRIVKPYLISKLNMTDDLFDYDPTITPDKEVIFQINSDEIEQYNIALSNPDDIEELNEEMDYENIWWYIIKVTNDDKELLVIRKTFPTHILKKWFSLWKNNGQYAKFESNIFTLDERMDAIKIGEYFYIFQRTNFERTFLFEIELKKQATRNAKELMSTHGILDISDDLLEECINDKQSISRLRKIDMSLLEDWTMSFENLKNFCTDFGVAVSIHSTEPKFQPSNKKEFKIFVKLLSDDFLESKLTNRKYDSHSKAILTNGLHA